MKQCLREYECAASKLGCHSAPKQTIHVLDQPDRPQPRWTGTETVGMVCPLVELEKIRC